MIYNEQNLKQLLEQPLIGSVYYYFSTEEYLVRSYAAKTLALLLCDDDTETTRVDGPAPDVGEAIAAAGTISMFATKRIVELPLMEPSAMKDADVDALCDVFSSLENAVFVCTTVFKDDKAQTTKKAKTLIAAAEKAGVVAQLLKPQPQDARRFITQTAEKIGASISSAAASALLERSGMDFFLLENEVQKLAAAAGYQEITTELVNTFGTKNIEADVFEMVRFVTARQMPRALRKLAELLDLQNEPVAITAALAGSFVDMYRVKCGAAQKQNYSTVHKELGYRGSDYRLKKSGETASSYTLLQLEGILAILARLDLQLKSSPADNVALLQSALCEMAAVGKR